MSKQLMTTEERIKFLEEVIGYWDKFKEQCFRSMLKYMDDAFSNVFNKYRENWNTITHRDQQILQRELYEGLRPGIQAMIEDFGKDLKYNLKYNPQ